MTVHGCFLEKDYELESEMLARKAGQVQDVSEIKMFRTQS